MQMSVLVCFCTCPESACAERIAEALVTEQLAACVNIVPGLLSVYRWQGEVMRDGECLLVIKTSATQWPALQARVQALHPYELPALWALPVSAGLPAYLEWVARATCDQTPC